MKILVTGGTGFIGRNIVPHLLAEHTVTLCGRSDGNDVKVDLSVESPELSGCFDIVFHAAGKAHTIPATKAEAQSFDDVNFEGTKNLCAALEKSGVPKSFVFLSSVAVYGCEEGENIDENHPLNGTTPYALSKIKAEEFLKDWCRRHNVTLGILRAPLVAGPNPPGNLGAMITGIRSGKYMSIGMGDAHKSILQVDDIPALIEAASRKGGIYNVCDNHHPTFRELEISIAAQLGGRRIISIPLPVASFFAKIGNILGANAPLNTSKLSKMTKSLTFSNQKAREELGWKPTDVLSSFKIS
ncbi:MAG: NAD-dependent epimerase/dehydratase family protein [Bacteroidales bacterium]|nr:NAD-dependent epimerase/dehydratase family protein [Bacteroidales bacterium]